MRLILLIILLFVGFNSEAKNWPMTGDHTIDTTLKLINELELQDEISEDYLLKEALRHLFTRAAFKYNLISEGSWDHFLYAVVRTNEILKYYSVYFNKSDKEILTQSIAILEQLEISVGELYGKSFNLNKHRKKYYSQEKFLSKLPSHFGRVKEEELTKPRNEMISKAMDKLKEIDLVD